MKTYNLIARPDIRYAVAEYGSSLSKDLLAQAVVGATVRDLRYDPRGGQYSVDVRLERPTHAQALDEIVCIVEQSGFYVVVARASEWANAAAERALLGALGAGGTIGLASENATVALIAAVSGAIVGSLVSTELYRLKAEYDARRDHQGKWWFRELPRQPVQDLQPGFLPA
jgi:hypothetical protein